MEQLRKKYLNTFWIISIIIFVICVAFAGSLDVFGLFAFIFGGILIFLTYTIINEMYAKKMKQNELLKVFNKYCEVISFDMKGGIEKDVVRYSGLIPIGNRYYTNDHFVLKYKGGNVQFCDLKIDNVQSTGKSTTTVNYFTGQFIILENNIYNQSDYYIQIREKEFFGQGANLREQKRIHDKIETFELESESFNEAYKVYGSDGQITFYVLNPVFMDKLMKLREKFEGRILISLTKNNIYIGIKNSKNYFESSIFENIDESMKEFENEIESLLSFIDMFNTKEN